MLTSPASWRGYYDFDSGARLLDWGAHTVDLCQWANHADDTMPIEYEPSPTNITARYANGVKLVLDFLKTPFGDRPGWFNHLGTCPVRFVGDEGWVEVGDSGEIEVSSAALKSELKQVDPKRLANGLDVSAHARNFFDCIKIARPDRGQPQGDASFPHRLPRRRSLLDAGPEAHARPRSARRLLTMKKPTGFVPARAGAVVLITAAEGYWRPSMRKRTAAAWIGITWSSQRE